MKKVKINFVVRMQHWMDSVPGQTFLNYAYSWGAAIVILGTLFKLTHLDGANLMLFIGMGTEVVVFFLSAFDRPFDKHDEGHELAEDYLNDEEITERINNESQARLGAGGIGGGIFIGGPSAEGEAAGNGTVAATGGAGGGTIIIGGSGNGEVAGAPLPAGDNTPSAELQQAAAGVGISGNSLLDIVRMANEELLHRAQAAVTPELEEASKEYVDKLKLLTETLDRVEKQSARLTTDSEEMTNLNRTLTGINTVYELQLKSISQQVGSIDRINEQTRHMAEQIEELNAVYARMIKALTVNMKNAAASNQ